MPQEALLSGSSEIRNWITVAGMVPHLAIDFMEYLPVYRTPLGTGIGLAFVTWETRLPAPAARRSTAAALSKEEL